MDRMYFSSVRNFQIIPVLPFALARRIDIDDEDVQVWISVILALYGGALLVGALIFGWIGDRLPKRHPIFLFGLLLLLVATVILSTARHVTVLVIGRLLQGFGAAIVWTSGLGLLTDIFGRERYGEAVGYAQTSVSIGTTSAPLLGGLVYSQAGYHAVSAMSIGTVTLSVVLALIMVEPKAKSELNGSALVPSFAGDDEQTVTAEEVSDVQRPTTIEPVPDPPDEQTALVRKSMNGGKSSNRPTYHLLLQSGRVLAAMGGFFTYSFVIVSFEGMIPMFVKDNFHWDSTRAALIFLSWIIPGFFAPMAGKASDRLGPRWIAVGGFLFAAPPLFCMRFITQDSSLHKVLLCSLLTLVGIGLVWVIPSCLSDLSAAAVGLKREHSKVFGDRGAPSQAFGLFIFSYSCGSLVGPTVVGTVRAKAGWGAATATLAFICIAACVPIQKEHSVAIAAD
ncbi:MAG: hypothetical protein M1836_006408 [Candelina mexicana]|nr:MAG: hypothetical protein M1836_006408 [Candelina mexicana]